MKSRIVEKYIASHKGRLEQELPMSVLFDVWHREILPKHAHAIIKCDADRVTDLMIEAASRADFNSHIDWFSNFKKLKYPIMTLQFRTVKDKAVLSQLEDVTLFVERKTEDSFIVWWATKTQGRQIILCLELNSSSGAVDIIVHHGRRISENEELNHSFQEILKDSAPMIRHTASLVFFLSDEMSNQQNVAIDKVAREKTSCRKKNRSKQASVTTFRLGDPIKKVYKYVQNEDHIPKTGSQLTRQRYVPKHVQTFWVKKENAQKILDGHVSSGRDCCVLFNEDRDGKVPMLLEKEPVIHRPDLPAGKIHIKVI